MLYTTTRCDKDAHTAYRALHENAAPDGGAFVPFRMPDFTSDEIITLCSEGFSPTVAAVMNRLFSARLTGWDVDFCIGRNAVKLIPMTHRIAIAELWHNPDGAFGHVVTSLFKKLSGDDAGNPSEWFTIAAHISVYFGLYSELCRDGVLAPGDLLDVAAPMDDLTSALAVIYARKMGLPIETIILSGENNSWLWDLIHLGELHTSKEMAKESFVERLLHCVLGNSISNAFLRARECGKVFRLDPEELQILNDGIFCSVSGGGRSLQNINSVYRSNGYIMEPTAALCVGGLQDYRAKKGESKVTLIPSCISPMNCMNQISEATGLSEQKIITLMDNSQNGRL